MERRCSPLDGPAQWLMLVSIDSSGGVNVLKLERPGTEWFHALRVSPDGRYLAFTKRAFRSDLVLLENF
jgi:hypothetical protein